MAPQRPECDQATHPSSSNARGRGMNITFQTIRRVVASDVRTLEGLLKTTVESVIPDALALRQGIKVTRVGPGNYLVETAPDVPCGYTICEPH